MIITAIDQQDLKDLIPLQAALIYVTQPDVWPQFAEFVNLHGAIRAEEHHALTADGMDEAKERLCEAVRLAAAPRQRVTRRRSPNDGKRM
jgi:Fe-S-cluster formation regulator IscX/YfhJ